MTDIKTIFEQLEATSSSKEKLKIIEANIDNKDFVDAFYLAYNPFINFFIKKLPKIESHNPVLSFRQGLENLVPLYKKEITGKHNREEYVKVLLSSMSEGDADILRRVIAKNLKCGCSRTTFNKVMNIIPKFSCLLAKDYDEVSSAKLKAPYYVQLKSDGSRACAIVSENSVTYHTREGNEYLMSVPHIDHHLITLRNQIGEDIMVDGEVVSISESGVCDRTKSNGIVNKAIVGSISAFEESNIRFYVWDCITMSCFNEGRDTTPYSERLSRLDPLKHYRLVEDGLEVSPTEIVNTLEEVEMIGQRYIEAGEEGAMVKSHDLIWEDKRSYHIQKIKAENECDLIVVGYNLRDENVAMNQGIGSLNCESADGKVKVSVSSGLSYEMVGYVKNGNSTYIYDDSFQLDKYNGQVVTIVYNKRILNKSGDGYTLFLPRIKTFRDDKHVADSIDRIRE